MSPEAHSQYRIKTVARLTGIPPATIRAWERRHGLLAPQRNNSGHRIYSEADVAVLDKVKALLETGLSIGEVSRAMQTTPETARAAAGGEREAPFEAIVEALVGAFAALDRDGADDVLRPVLPLHAFEVTFERIFAPALVRLGELWRAGGASVAAEHFGAAFVQRKLIAMISAVSAPGKNRPKALLACLEGERHELGLLYLALRLSARGWSTIYLGTDMPIDGLVVAVEQVQPGIVALSLTRADRLDETLAHVARLCAAAGRTTVVIGGAAGCLAQARLEAIGARVVAGGEDLDTVVQEVR